MKVGRGDKKSGRFRSQTFTIEAVNLCVLPWISLAIPVSKNKTMQDSFLASILRQ